MKRFISLLVVAFATTISTMAQNVVNGYHVQGFNPIQFLDNVRIDGDTATVLNKLVVGRETAPTATSAIFEVVDTSLGVILPRVTTDAMNAISSPDNGLILYNTTESAFYYYDGSSWSAIGAGSGGGTLNDAYNSGGSGNGRAIDAENGPVEIGGAGGLTVNYGDFFLANDSLDLGIAKPRAVGFWSDFNNPYGSGFWKNILTDWSGLGGEAMEMRLGFQSPSFVSSMLVIDTNAINILGRQIVTTSDSTLEFNAPLTTINTDSLIVTEGTTQFISIGATGNAFITATDKATVRGKNEIYLTSKSDASNWEFGFSAFDVDSASCCNGTATMYALDQNELLDVSYFYVDTLKTMGSHRYGVASTTDYIHNSIIADSAKVGIGYGNVEGAPSWTPPTSTLLSVDSLGVQVVSTTAAFYPPRMTAVQSSAVTPSNGAIVYVTSTDATFTQVGFWGYVNGTWTALH